MTHSKAALASSLVVLLSLGVGCRKKPTGGAHTYLTLDLGEGVTMKLVLIPTGKFMMGSPESPESVARKSGGKADWYKDEHPQHEVTISPGAPGFYMGIYEVTQEQYQAVMGKNPAEFKDAKNPVETVSWDDAVAFCKALSKKAGRMVRLPTEAEWEYACRAGSQTRFCFGDDEKQFGDYAWYSANSGSKTHPVGQKKPNAWGLYDMYGNVYEWCSDWYADSYANAKAVDPQGPGSGSIRVVRGGTWGLAPWECRSADRGRSAPDFRYKGIGFRAVISPRPDTIKGVHMERLVVKELPVELAYTGATLVGNPKIDPANAKIRVAETTWARIHKAAANPVVKTQTLDLKQVQPGETVQTDLKLVAFVAGKRVVLVTETVNVTVKVEQRTDTKKLTVSVAVLAPPEWAEDGTWEKYILVRKDKLEWRPTITVTGTRADLEILEEVKKEVQAYIVLNEGHKKPSETPDTEEVQIRFPQGLRLKLVGEKLEVSFNMKERVTAPP